MLEVFQDHFSCVFPIFSMHLFFGNSLTSCCYSRIGCPWRGPFHESKEHENVCTHPHKSGAEVMETLLVMDNKLEQEKRLYDHIFDMLNYEKVIFNGKSLVVLFFYLLNFIVVQDIYCFCQYDFYLHQVYLMQICK